MRNVFPLLVTAWRSLLVHKLRSFLSTLGVVCGVMAVMAMISTGEGAKREILAQIEDMGLKNIYIKRIPLSEEQQREAGEKKSYGLSLDDLRRLQQNGGNIVRVAAIQELVATPIGTQQEIIPKVIQCTADYAEILSLTAASGRFITPQDCERNALVCVLGASIAQRMGKEGQIGQFVRLQDSLYKIVGILAEYKTPEKKMSKVSKDNFNTTLLIPLVMNDYRGTPATDLAGSAPVTEIIVEVDKKQHVVAVSSMIHRLLQVTHNTVQDYQLLIPLQLLTQSLRTQRVFDLVLAVTGGISLFIGGIGIMNIMLAAVSERKREIGLRRAVGATKRDIVLQFLTESVLLTSGGGIVGVLAGFICVDLIETTAGWSMRITAVSLLVPFFLAVSTGVFFGLYPAIQAAKLDPIHALRSL
jgi:putative ABC transport system permease protein